MHTDLVLLYSVFVLFEQGIGQDSN